MTDVTLDSSVEEWTSVATATSITVGNAMTIQNKGSAECYVIASDTQPDADSIAGALITGKGNYASVITTDTGDDEYWVRPVIYGQPVTLYVEEQ